MRRAQKLFAATVDGLSAARKSNTTTHLTSIPSWIESNDEFHGVVIEASGNRRLKQMIQDLHLGFTKNIMLADLMMNDRRMRENLSEHDSRLAHPRRSSASPSATDLP